MELFVLSGNIYYHAWLLKAVKLQKIPRKCDVGEDWIPIPVIIGEKIYSQRECRLGGVGPNALIAAGRIPSEGQSRPL